MWVLSKGFLKSSAAAGKVSIWKILIRHHNIFVDLSRAASKKIALMGREIWDMFLFSSAWWMSWRWRPGRCTPTKPGAVDWSGKDSFNGSWHGFKNPPFLPFSRVFADKEAMMAGAMDMAAEIAGRSPVAVQGTKINLIYSRDHSVAEGLDYMVTHQDSWKPLITH